MSQGANGTSTMAFTNNSRSFDNMSNGTDKKSTNGTLNATLGRPNAWGSSDIWSGGLTSTAPTRHSAVARDNSQQRVADEAEGKTGSGSLLDSSAPEFGTGPGWAGKRSNGTGRTPQNARAQDSFAQQQRSASSAGLSSMTFAAQNMMPSYTGRGPTFNLNAAAQARQSFSSAYSSGLTGRSNDPPAVYTKFDRPSDPMIKSKPGPDSAVVAWGDQSTPSPIEERRAQFPFHRTGSMPTSRDGSAPPSRHSDIEPPMFTQPDYSRPTQRPTPNSSRAPSISSQRNGFGGVYMNGGADRLTSQFGQLSMNGDGRSGMSLRGAMTNAGANGCNGYSASSMRRPSIQLANGNPETSFEVEELDRGEMRFLGGDNATPRQHDYLNGYAERYFQADSPYEFQPGQPYTGNGLALRSYEQDNGSRSSEWQSSSKHSLALNRRSPALTDQQAYLDPRMRAYMSSTFPPYGAVYSPYALTNPMQLNPYMAVMPMGMPGMDMTNGARDNPPGDGVQSALMYEFKSNTKTKRYELRDIYDHIAEFSGDQHGSRFIQTKLETANSDEKDRVFTEIEPNAIPLMTDVFGNYVIQKFFEHGDQRHKKTLANKMRGQVLSLSKQMYGCRVVQKALEHVLVDQQAQLVDELQDHVMDCVKDQNGNHVIQKAIERCTPGAISFIIASFQGQVHNLSIHAYGCRVIQRCLEKCDLPQKSMIMAELLQSIPTMITDQFGNYVVQHIVAHDDGEGRRLVLDIVLHNLEGYSKHKFASNVVEKCLEKSDDQWRHQVVVQLANSNQRRTEGEGLLVGIIRDNFGNYVIQKILDMLNDNDYFLFLDQLQPAMAQAKRAGCGKQLLSIEKKMHKFGDGRNGSVNSATGGGSFHRSNLAPTFIAPPVFAGNYNATSSSPPNGMNGPPRHSGMISSTNSDAVEGAMNKSRQDSEQSHDNGIRM